MLSQQAKNLIQKHLSELIEKAKKQKEISGKAIETAKREKAIFDSQVQEIQTLKGDLK